MSETENLKVLLNARKLSSKHLSIMCDFVDQDDLDLTLEEHQRLADVINKTVRNCRQMFALDGELLPTDDELAAVEEEVAREKPQAPTRLKDLLGRVRKEA